MIVDGLVDLLDSRNGFAVIFDGYRPDEETAISRLTLSSHQDASMLRISEDWGRRSQFSEDPMIAETWGVRKNYHTFAHSQRLQVGDPPYARMYEEFWVPVRAQDTMVSYFRYPNCDKIRGCALHRTRGQKHFALRDRRLAQLFTRELYLLYREGGLEAPGLLDALPPRLQTLAPLLLTHLGQKQIAAQLGLSYHTVRSYVKELYDLMQVGSREELAAKLREDRPDGGAP